MKKWKKTAALLLSALLTAGLAGCGQDAASETANNVAMGDAQVTLCDYRNIPVTTDDPGVSEDEVDSYLEMLIYYYNLQADSGRTVIEDGDTVWVELYLYDEDSNLLDDGSDHEGFVYIGTGQTYPELEAGLVGKEVGIQYEIPITLDDPYEFDESLSGQTITAKVIPEYIRETEELSLDTLTDDQVVLIMGEGDEINTVEKMRDNARAMLADEQEYTVRYQAYSAICEYLLENCTIDPFPGAELEARVEQNMEQSRELCETYYGISFEEYLGQLDMTEEEYRADIESTVTDTIRLEVIFTAIGDAEGIEYDESEYDAYIEQIVQAYLYDSADDLYEQYGEDYVKRAYRIEYIVDWLIDQADLSYTAAE